MKQVLRFTMLVVCLLLGTNGFAQVLDRLSPQQVADRYDYLTKVVDYPAAKCYPGTRTAWLGLDEGLDLLYLTSDSIYLLTHSLEDMETETVCYEPEVDYQEDGILTYECRVMRGLVDGMKLEIRDYQLHWLEDYMYDLNEENYAEAEQAQQLNDPIMYCHAYMGMQYYMDLNYRTLEAAVWADSLAFACYERAEYDSAAMQMLQLEQECDIARSEWSAEVDLHAFIRVWGNATHYYLRAGKYEECVRLCQWLLERYPKLSQVQLPYADALYALDRKAAAGQQYASYQQSMIAAGDRRKIPARVKLRLAQ